MSAAAQAAPSPELLEQLKSRAGAYVVTHNDEGNPCRAVSELKPGSEVVLELTLSKGDAIVTLKQIYPWDGKLWPAFDRPAFAGVNQGARKAKDGPYWNVDNVTYDHGAGKLRQAHDRIEGSTTEFQVQELRFIENRLYYSGWVKLVGAGGYERERIPLGNCEFVRKK